MSNLGPREAHLWLTYEEELTEPALLARYEQLLTPEERARRDRFLFAHDRHRFLVTRALVRTTLSRYAPAVPPEAWRFRENRYGRPEIQPEASGPGAAEAAGLRFNLSHTRGLIACLVARGREVGVDVEDATRRVVPEEIADRFFSPREAAELLALPEAEARRERFFTYWTLKESYIKARGMGLSLPLDKFSFLLDGPAVSIDIDPELSDEPGRWQFRLLRPSARHRAAAVERGPQESIALSVAEVVPLSREGALEAL